MIVVVWHLQLAVDCSDADGLSAWRGRILAFINKIIRDKGLKLSVEIELRCTPRTGGKRQNDAALSDVEASVTYTGEDLVIAEEEIPMYNTTSEEIYEDEDGLSGGGVAGIVIGSVAAAAMIAAVSFLAFKHFAGDVSRA